MNKTELASMLRRFVGDEPNCGAWEWDDFVSVCADSELEPYRLRLLKYVSPLLGNDEKALEVGAILRATIADLEASA